VFNFIVKYNQKGSEAKVFQQKNEGQKMSAQGRINRSMLEREGGSERSVVFNYS
jgi:hypothetical protein